MSFDLKHGQAAFIVRGLDDGIFAGIGTANEVSVKANNPPPDMLGRIGEPRGYRVTLTITMTPEEYHRFWGKYSEYQGTERIASHKSKLNP